MGRKTSRPALNPGPRCDEHKHARKRTVAKRAHANRIAKAFIGITQDIYDRLYEAQKAFIATQFNWKGERLKGACYGCGKATGKARALAVDHDHRCAELNGTDHAPEVGCLQCIRALLCGQCNTILGRYDAGALRRLVKVLEDPPAQHMLREMGLL
jgi:hypothetical protein